MSHGFFPGLVLPFVLFVSFVVSHSGFLPAHLGIQLPFGRSQQAKHKKASRPSDCMQMWILCPSDVAEFCEDALALYLHQLFIAIIIHERYDPRD